jgi:hypothetical protein
MALHAFLKNNVVVKVDDIANEEQYFQEMLKGYQNIIDVSGLLISPEVGWVLQGNQIVPSPSQQITVQKMIESRIKHYQSLAPQILVDLYVQNTLLGITAAQSHAMFVAYSDVLLAIREGAFPTALYALQQKQPEGFVTQEMIDGWINLLQSRIQA